MIPFFYFLIWRRVAERLLCCGCSLAMSRKMAIAAEEKQLFAFFCWLNINGIGGAVAKFCDIRCACLNLGSARQKFVLVLGGVNATKSFPLW